MKLPSFSIHEYIKWSAKDEEGEYNHVGQIIALDETKVTFRTKHGVMSIEYTNGEFEKTKAIKLDDPTPGPRIPVTSARAPIVIQTRRRDPNAATKLERAMELYQSLTDKTRKNVIKVLIDQLGMTPAGASTYQAICKKKYPS